MDKNKKIEFWNNEEFRENFDEAAVSRSGGTRKRGGERISCFFGRINEKRPCGRFFMR